MIEGSRFFWTWNSTALNSDSVAHLPIGEPCHSLVHIAVKVLESGMSFIQHATSNVVVHMGKQLGDQNSRLEIAIFLQGQEAFNQLGSLAVLVIK